MPANDKPANKQAWLGLLFPVYAAFILAATLVSSHLSLDPSPRPEATPAEAALPATPPDFAEISDIQERKDAFFGYFRPIIALQNEQLRQQRTQIQALQARLDEGRSLSRAQHQQLRQWAEAFSVEATGPEAKIEELLLRVNVIPEALVLAQAAAESAWGTSRFAQEAYNYFGQWCFRAGCGLVPNRRIAGARHEVAKFSSPIAAVEAYFRNLNTFHTYEDFRQKRQALTEQERPLTAHELAGELVSYSERGEDYIEELRVIIRFNELE